MRGASLASLTAARGALGRELAGAASAVAMERADELFAVVDALDAAPAALRALANPNRPAEPKRAMVRRIMDGHNQAACEFVAEVVVARWSRDADLSDALERLGVEACLIAIGSQDALEAFEGELFSVQRFLAAEPAVRGALADTEASGEARVRLAERLWAPTLTKSTMTLLTRVVRAPRRRSLTSSLILLAELSAERRGRMVAVVLSAVELTADQRERLASALRDAYGHQVRLDIVHDTAVVGGLRIEIGSDVLDATLLARFAALRRAIAS
ncbi:MAG: F0F1 ATP synthase subunit delta [Bifidobacteriaceae bacterium]|jgi:F-type H+-transporting ATPase subunit delta|nr:F0F1 ATP synthase subunit delta [Bifidobacteriaceae bacterium]